MDFDLLKPQLGECMATVWPDMAQIIISQLKSRKTSVTELSKKWLRELEHDTNAAGETFAYIYLVIYSGTELH